MGGDELVDQVEVGGVDPVHPDHHAVANDQLWLRVRRRIERNQPQFRTRLAEAVEVDQLLVHETQATDRRGILVVVTSEGHRPPSSSSSLSAIAEASAAGSRERAST